MEATAEARMEARMEATLKAEMETAGCIVTHDKHRYWVIESSNTVGRVVCVEM